MAVDDASQLAYLEIPPDEKEAATLSRVAKGASRRCGELEHTDLKRRPELTFVGHLGLHPNVTVKEIVTVQEPAARIVCVERDRH